MVRLHDNSLTILLTELSFMRAGSHGRIPEDGADPFSRSGLMLTGTDFSNADISWVGDNPAEDQTHRQLAKDSISYINRKFLTTPIPT